MKAIFAIAACFVLFVLAERLYQEARVLNTAQQSAEYEERAKLLFPDVD